MDSLSEEFMREIFRGRTATNIRWLGKNHLTVDWNLGKDSVDTEPLMSKPVQTVVLPSSYAIGIRIHKTTSDIYTHVLLNSNHPFVKWLEIVRGACDQSKHGLNHKQLRTLMELIHETTRRGGGRGLQSLIAYLDGWRKISNLPAKLHPPKINLEPDMFVLKPPENLPAKTSSGRAPRSKKSKRVQTKKRSKTRTGSKKRK